MTRTTNHRNGSATADDINRRFAEADEAPNYSFDIGPTIKPAAGTSRPERQERITLAELCAKHTTLNRPVVDGLIREGETVNIIANSKAGKSWLLYGLTLSVANGLPWLGKFDTAQGKVLLIDNELHPSTLAHRIPAVGRAMGLDSDRYDLDVDVLSLRGKLRGWTDLACDFDHIAHGEYKIIGLDAKYRFALSGASENDNAAETQIYNMLDQYAAKTGAAFVLIHHASKGNQTDKRVTDVGAGAGAQSRAADCHLVLREHEEEGVVVLDAAVRSFAPVEPLALRWNFPLWVPASGVDPADLKGRKTRAEEQRSADDRAGFEIIIKVLRDGPMTARKLREKTGIGKDRQQRLLDKLTAQGDLTAKEIVIRGNPCNQYSLAK